MLSTDKNYSKLRRDATATGKLSMLTAYDFNTAMALEKAGIDSILVGDSLAMVALGYQDTTEVTPEEMQTFTAAVRRGAPSSIVTTDVPLKTFQKEIPEIIKDCQGFIDAGANFVKIEGASAKAIELIQELKKHSIEVLGHIGYTPQDIEKFKGSKLVSDEAALLRDAKLLDENNVIGMVIEMVPADLAEKVTAAVAVPTIGIGAGKACDGQVLVTDDMLGRFAMFKPKFVKRYSEQFEDAKSAIENFVKDIKSGDFPV